jgi:hypothetical protein
LSYWYSGARWNLPHTNNISLATVLLFSNFSFEDERRLTFDTLDRHYDKMWDFYLSIANHANVGELRIKLDDEDVGYWAMKYSSDKYYAMHRKRGLIKGNPNLINKIRIGSTKKSVY